MRSRRHLCVIVALAFIVAACGREDPDVASERVVASPVGSATAKPKATSTPRRSAAAAPTVSSAPRRTSAPRRSPNLASADIKLTKLKEMDEPVVLAIRTNDSTMYIAEKGGRVRAVKDNGTGSMSTVLDISSEVTNNGEQGLLGLAFGPKGNKMYVYFTNRAGDQVIREYTFSGGRAQTSTARKVLEMDDPYGNHNGGHIVFGPDGYMYIGTGDGGSAGDPQNRAQNLDDLLGKMLRIDPLQASGSLGYSIPRSNPFVGRDGRDEIWAYGLRNPWRFSFDKNTRAMWIGDVGQGNWEEINVASGGSDGGDNYGWRRMEGNHSFGGGSAPSNHHGPIYEYSHDDGNCSVTGGYVYRGSNIPDLRGAYVFADFCVGALRAFVERAGAAINHRFLGPKVGNLASFGQGGKGELYVLSLSGGVYRIDPA